MKGLAIAAVVATAILAGSAACGAAETAQRVGYGEGSLRKLGRGAANLVTAPLEMIRTTSLVNERDGWIAGLTVGFTQGLAATAVRAVAGVVELATFLVPIPKNFEPLVRPEFVFQHGHWTT